MTEFDIDDLFDVFILRPSSLRDDRIMPLAETVAAEVRRQIEMGESECMGCTRKLVLDDDVGCSLLLALSRNPGDTTLIHGTVCPACSAALSDRALREILYRKIEAQPGLSAALRAQAPIGGKPS